MQVIIVGGGIGGLSLALALHGAGITCRVFESAPEIKPLGVGLNLLPHAVKELTALGLLDDLLERGVETQEVTFYTRHGQLVHREPRGKHAGYPVPQISIHRADLHEALMRAVLARLGKDAVVLGHHCAGASEEEDRVVARFTTANGTTTATGDILVGCDGIHSVLRQQLFGEQTGYRFHGTVQYRGVTRRKPFLTGKSMAYVGTANTGKLVVYPIRKGIGPGGIGSGDDDLINWVVEIAREDCGVRDWNRRASAADFIDALADWHFDWLDVPALIESADSIYEYPVVDQDPLTQWTVGRTTLLGDAAHPMLPRGSNGAAQAIIDANALARILAKTTATSNLKDALSTYEALRRPATSQVVLMNRDRAPDAILKVVEDRTGGQPFGHLDAVITPAEILEWQEAYKRTAGFQPDQVRGNV